MHRFPLVRALQGAGLALLASAAVAPSAWAADPLPSLATPPELGAAPSFFKNLNPDAAGSAPADVTATPSGIAFTADDGQHGRELYVGTGAAGSAQMVDDLRPGPTGSGIRELTAVGSELFFVADDGISGTQLWASDGTADGTDAVTEGTFDGAPASIKQVLHAGDQVFIVATTAAGDVLDLLQEDGTLARIGTFTVASAASMADQLILTTGEGDVFTVDAAGVATQVGDGTPDGLLRGATGLAAGENSAYVATADRVYLVSGAQTVEIGGTAGPIAGATLLGRTTDGGVLLSSTADDAYEHVDGEGAVLSVALPADAIGPPVFAGGRIFFVAGPADAPVLYVADGTDDPAAVPLGEGRAVTSITSLVVDGDGVDFVIDDDGQSLLMHSADGTSAGTVPLTTGDTFPGEGTITGVTPAAGGGVYFAGNGADAGNELFRTAAAPPAGDPAPPALIGDVNPAHESGAADAANAIAFGAETPQTLFQGDDGMSITPWVSDGTPQGTHTLFPGSMDDLHLEGSAALDERALMLVRRGESDKVQLLSTDGTDTTVLTASNLDGPGGIAKDLVSAGGAAYYLTKAPPSSPDYAIYSTDGVEPGKPFDRPTTWPQLESVRALAAVGSTLYAELYSTYSDSYTLWSLDTTTGRSEKLTVPSTTPLRLSDAAAAGSRLYFGYPVDSVGQQLWVTDGTTDGTHQIDGPALSGGQPLAFSAGGTVFADAYDTDAQMNVLERVVGNRMVPVADPEEDGSFVPTILQALTVGDTAYVRTNDTLYALDAAGTVRIVAHLDRQTMGPEIGPLLPVNGRLYFPANADGAGAELWVSDGTTDGTHLLADLNPGADGSDPGELFAVGDVLLFQATLPATGQQLFGYPAPADYPTTPVATPTPTPTPEPSATPTPTATPELPAPTETPAPAAAATPTPAPPAAAPSATPTPTPATTTADARPVPRKLTATVLSSRDATAPYGFRLKGTLTPAAGLSAKAECTGTAQIRVTRTTSSKGKSKTTVIATYGVSLRFKGGACTYDRRITLPGKTKPGGTVRATVTFTGTKTQQPRSAKPVVLHLGRK